MRILLDTNAYSALMRGVAEVADRVRRAERVLVSPIVIGELLYGFRNGSRNEENTRQLDTFLENPFVELVTVTRTTADRFAGIALGLKRKGRPLPVNDVWIAAQALETGADLLSSDGHFGEVEGLSWLRFG
ncbi:MAG TPA: type II toxin-antitoxin system VapC family toxin [Gemmatimonadota bacterium]|nr:type II toxin-antitoxin system VapC family toxin [Gemmatimonadota bacterium]